MLAVDKAVGLDRLGNWLRGEAFTARGRYEDADPMGGAGRVADWIELSCLLSPDGFLSKVSVIDHLVDSGVLHNDPDKAEEQAELIADNGFAELRQRRRLIGSSAEFGFPFEFPDPKVLKRTADWSDAPVYAFLLIVSAGQLDPWMYKKDGGTTYDEVGHLFEHIVARAASGLFRGPSEVLAPTGPAKQQMLATRVESLVGPFGLKTSVAISRVPVRVKDAGLDVITRLDCGDTRPGLLHLLIQCAAGANWNGKLGTPALADWRAWVEWRGPLLKGFAVPTIFGDDGVIENASRSGEWSLFLDRVRILHGLRGAGGLDVGELARVSRWCRMRIDTMRKRKYAS